MTNLSTEHTLIAAIPILVVLAVLSAAIIVFPKVNLDTSSRATEPVIIPTTIEPSITPYTFPLASP
ncbi:hypothetical protein KJ953_03775 [Patescibacteria group bacterium]|nr:hypothetical protein [Patescibacteria group bacterium]MBU1457531.1 hypothetical protein [Patescibacteria group bacterium]